MYATDERQNMYLCEGECVTEENTFVTHKVNNPESDMYSQKVFSAFVNVSTLLTTLPSLWFQNIVELYSEQRCVQCICCTISLGEEYEFHTSVSASVSAFYWADDMLHYTSNLVCFSSIQRKHWFMEEYKWTSSKLIWHFLISSWGLHGYLEASFLNSCSFQRRFTFLNTRVRSLSGKCIWHWLVTR